jgi:hypothetical protein
MATRMQQRRGTASQWTTANPILATGEIGFETDTNQFKIGDGTNHWADLSYFKNLEDLGGSLDDYVLIADLGAPGSAASLDVNGYIPVNQLGNILGDAPAILDTLEELAGALQDADGLVTIKINTKADSERLITNTDIQTAIGNEEVARDAAIAEAIDNSTTEITNAYNGAITEAIADEANARDAAIAESINNEVSLRDAAIADEETARDAAIAIAIGNEVTARDAAITQEINTATGALEDYADTAATAAQGAAETSAQAYISTHNSGTTNVHGISDTSALVTLAGAETLTNKTITGSDNTFSAIPVSALANVTASTQELNILDGVTVSAAKINYLTGLTDNIQTQLDAKAPTANPTFTGTLAATDISITGDLTVGGTTTTVNATDLVVTDPLIYIGEGNDANIVDLGLVSSFNNGAYQHAGIVRDATDGVWKLFSSVEDEPTTTINFSQAVYDTLKVGGIEFADGIQVKQGVPSLTAINQKNVTSWSPELTDRDKLVELNSSSPITVTLGADMFIDFPVGTSIDILQTGTGQVTIQGGAGVTVNATPGLKLRTQWSSATLFKRAADTWVVFGDLSA